MSVVAIEISDVGLNAFDDSGPIGTPSPGYVLLDRRELVSGEAARSVARLRPRFVSHRHWDRLDTEPVGRPFPRGLSHADLVHAHLSRYWSDLTDSVDLPESLVSVVLAVPGSYSHDQLSLLLGIARACGIPVTGLVDSSLVGLDRSTTSETVLHLDIQLHRAVWTVIAPVDHGRGDGSRRREVESVESAGLVRFQESWVRLLADRFVRESRFDPLHHGSSEQTLYDRIPGWLREVEAEGSVVVSLESNGQLRSSRVTSSQLTAAAQAEIDAIADSAAHLLAATSCGGLALASRTALIPGLATRLAELAALEPVVLPAGAAAAGAVRHRDYIEAQGNESRDHEVPLVLDLPALQPHG